MVPDNVFKEDDMVDMSAAKTPAIKRPATPGNCYPIWTILNGTIWSIQFNDRKLIVKNQRNDSVKCILTSSDWDTRPSRIGPQCSYVAYIIRPKYMDDNKMNVVPIQKYIYNWFKNMMDVSRSLELPNETKEWNMNNWTGKCEIFPLLLDSGIDRNRWTVVR